MRSLWLLWRVWRTGRRLRRVELRKAPDDRRSFVVIARRSGELKTSWFTDDVEYQRACNQRLSPSDYVWLLGYDRWRI